MSFLTTTPTIGARPATPPELSPFVSIRLLRAFMQFVDAHGWISFAAVSVACGWGHLTSMVSRHLDHDELFTYYIAQAPTLRELLTLTRTIDLHPPLSFLLVRASFWIFGPSAWSCRLPFFAAFVLTSALLFFLLSRIASPVYGLIATLILWSSPYAHLATEARPYALLLCFTALLIVGWYRSVEVKGLETRLLRLALIAASGFALLLSHILGVVAFGAFFGAEIVRLWIRRKPDWPLWAALTIPLASAAAYLPLIRLRSDLLFSQFSQATPRRLAICYWEHVRYVATPLTIIALIGISWPYLSKRLGANQSSSTPSAISLRWLLLFLFLVPLEIEILFARTGTPFYERYGVVALLPCAAFPALFLAVRTRCDRIAATGIALLLALLIFVNTSGKAWLTEQLSSFLKPTFASGFLYFAALPPIAPPPLTGPFAPAHLENALYATPRFAHLDTVDPGLPLVAGTGPTFLELDRYEDDSVTHRLYLLTNHAAAVTIVHNTVFDHYELVKAAFPVRGQVQPYCSFLREHSEFLVLGGYNYPDTWVLKKLERDGARLSILGTYDDGAIEEHQIYKVSVEGNPCVTQP